MESGSVDSSVVQEEWDDMVKYARKYLNLVQDYLFNTVDSKRWCNVLAVTELLFCLPISNGHLERVFSQLKLIKVNRQICFCEDTLDHLIRTNVEGPPSFNEMLLVQWNYGIKIRLGGLTRKIPAPMSSPHLLFLLILTQIWMTRKTGLLQVNSCNYSQLHVHAQCIYMGIIIIGIVLHVIVTAGVQQ